MVEQSRKLFPLFLDISGEVADVLFTIPYFCKSCNNINKKTQGVKKMSKKVMLDTDYVDALSRIRLGAPHYRILLYLACRTKATISDVAEGLSMARQNVYRYIKELTSWKLVRPEGKSYSVTTEEPPCIDLLPPEMLPWSLAFPDAAAAL